MQPACGSVGTSPELAAGVQLGHHEFDPGRSGLLLHVNGDPPASATPHSHRQHRHGHRVAMPTSAPSTALSMISHTCINPRESVDPDVHARTLRTASKPSRPSVHRRSTRRFL